MKLAAKIKYDAGRLAPVRHLASVLRSEPALADLTEFPVEKQLRFFNTSARLPSVLVLLGGRAPYNPLGIDVCARSRIDSILLCGCADKEE